MERRREDEMRNGEKNEQQRGSWVLYNNFTDGFTKRN
jgi:hypothetical protein